MAFATETDKDVGRLGRCDCSPSEVTDWSGCALRSCGLQHFGHGTWNHHSHSCRRYYYLDWIRHRHIQVEPSFCLWYRRCWRYHVRTNWSRNSRDSFLSVLVVRVWLCYAWSIDRSQRGLNTWNVYRRVCRSSCCYRPRFCKRPHAWPHELARMGWHDLRSRVQ